MGIRKDRAWASVSLLGALLAVSWAPAQERVPAPPAPSRKTTAKPGIDPEKTGPIRHYIMVRVLDGTDLLDVDRWYLTYHARETLRRTERRQTKYATSRTYTLPPDQAAAMNFWHGRMSEIGFASLADFDKGWLEVDLDAERRKQTLPPAEIRGGFSVGTATIKLKPDEVFVEHPTPPKGTPYFRWIFFYEYPDGVAEEAGEKWFHQVFAKELAARPEVRRFVTYETVVSSQKWRRAVELWFDRHKDWKSSIYDRRAEFTKPYWGGQFPFLKFQSTFIGENPDVDFLTERQAIP